MRARLRARRLTLALVAAFGLAGCAPNSSQTIQQITVYSTSAASPWRSDAYDCSPPSAAIVLSDGPHADLALRLGAPTDLTGTAYQIGTDDLLVVTHPEVGTGPLEAAQVQALFAGQIRNWSEVGGLDAPVQVWAFAPTVDVQIAFDQEVMHGRPVSSLARLAVSAQDMSDSVGAVPGSVGLLPRRWKAGNTREVMRISSLPVLALVRRPPEGALAELLGCMQARP